MDLKEYGRRDWIHLAQGQVQWRTLVSTAMGSVSMVGGSLSVERRTDFQGHRSFYGAEGGHNASIYGHERFRSDIHAAVMP